MVRPHLPLALTQLQVGTESNSRVVNTPVQYSEGPSSNPVPHTHKFSYSRGAQTQICAATAESEYIRCGAVITNQFRYTNSQLHSGNAMCIVIQLGAEGDFALCAAGGITGRQLFVWCGARSQFLLQPKQ